MKYYECETGSILQGDVLREMSTIDDKSVNCIITSPPYWQLRDYGYSEQWGLEPTYQEYLEHLWQFMDEVWRVLRDDGTVWINLGDTYSGNGVTGGNIDKPKQSIQSKCLLLIPHRFAIGCIDRGWILRNDIIWAKRNGMPESVTDRFSKKHEYFFFMVKSQKYYFDLDKVLYPLSKSSIKRLSQNVDAQKGSDRVPFKTNGNMKAVGNIKGKNPGDVSDLWNIPTKPSKSKHHATYNSELIDKPIIAGCPDGGVILDPFNGTGTTILRAEQLRRKWIGIDASKEYCEIAKRRMNTEMSQLKLKL